MYNFTSLQVLVYKEGSKIDVLGLSETYIVDRDESDYAGLFKIDIHILIKRNCSYGKVGGVAMYVKISIKFKQRQDLANPLLEIIVIKFFIKSTKSICLLVITEAQRDQNMYHLIIMIHSMNI